MKNEQTSSKSLNFIANLLAVKIIDKIPYPEEEKQKINSYAKQGALVYVHRARGVIWHLALSRAISRLNLPKIAFAPGAKNRLLMPFFGLWQVILNFFGRSQKNSAKTASDSFAGAFKKGQASEIFLRQPSTLIQENDEDTPSFVTSLVTLQRITKKSIFLAPHLLVFRSRPTRFQPTAADLVFGTSVEPGFLRSLARIILLRKSARFEVLEVLNLQEFLTNHENLPDDVVAKKVRWALLAQMDKAERAFHGPALKSALRMQNDTLRDPELKAAIATIAKDTGVSQEKYKQKCKRYYSEIAAKFDMDVTRFMDSSLSLIWRKIYEGLSCEPHDMQNLRKASAKGPLVILPSHKSHVDYLVMSQILYHGGLMPPHIAAGTNLSFFPISNVLRRGGAYFIRRTFKGDVLYGAVVQAYLKRLFKEGFTQEFFIEGGRSRTGKTLTPKYGLLGMMVNALTAGKIQNAVFVPASISYEKLMEAQSYKSELQGGKKAKESVLKILNALKILKKRYGKVFVTFDRPIEFKEFLAEQNFDPSLATEEEKRRLVKVFAHKIVFGINRCSMITPTAVVVMALFGAKRRTLSKTLLVAYVNKILQHIKLSAGELARFSPGLQDETKTQIDRALELMIADGLIGLEKAGKRTYYRISEDSALSLEYYKNNIIHNFVQDSIVANAMVALGAKQQQNFTKEELLKTSKTLSQIFKYEFVFPVGMTFEENFERAFNIALKMGILVQNSGSYTLTSSNKTARQIFEFSLLMTANFVDSYFACTQKIKLVVEQANSVNSLTLKLLDQIRAAYLNGTVEFAECASKVVVQNALKLFSEVSILDLNGDKPKLKNRDENIEYQEMLSVLQKAHYNRMFG